MLALDLLGCTRALMIMIMMMMLKNQVVHSLSILSVWAVSLQKVVHVKCPVSSV